MFSLGCRNLSIGKSITQQYSDSNFARRISTKGIISETEVISGEHSNTLNINELLLVRQLKFNKDFLV